MCLMGCLMTLGLWLLSVPLVLTLGLLAAVLAFVPYIGAVLTAVPVMLFALAQSPRGVGAGVQVTRGQFDSIDHPADRLDPDEIKPTLRAPVKTDKASSGSRGITRVRARSFPVPAE